MKRMFICWLVLGAVIFAGRADERHPLPRLGAISLPTGWREIERGTNFGDGPPHYWITFQRQTNELLSFLIRANERPRDTNTIHFADTAHELFPDGYYYETHPWKPDETSLSPLRVRIDAVGRFEALFTSFVIEHKPPAENRMAHSCVLFGEHTVFVQHTSTRPISTELIESVAYSVMRELERLSPRDRLRLFRSRVDY